MLTSLKRKNGVYADFSSFASVGGSEDHAAAVERH
jgi:hypothetical protein